MKNLRILLACPLLMWAFATQGIAQNYTCKVRVYDLTPVGANPPEVNVNMEATGLMNDYHEAGYHSVTWNGVDGEGQTVASGIYIARFNVTNKEGIVAYSTMNKLLLIK